MAALAEGSPEPINGYLKGGPEREMREVDLYMSGLDQVEIALAEST